MEEQYVRPYDFNDESNSICNLIQPSDDIIKMRINELHPADFKLDHLNNDYKKTLSSLLWKNAQAFSKSLSTFGDTDLVTPQIKLLNSHPIKSLPYPVPQTQKAEILK